MKWAWYFLFYVLFRNISKREELDENNFRRCYVFFSRKSHSKSTWQQLCSKFFFPIVRTRLDIGILKTPYNRRFWFHMDQHRCRSCIWLIIACFSFSQTRLFFKFNLVLIERFSPEFINIFTFRCSLYLEFHPVPLDFFRENQ